MSAPPLRFHVDRGGTFTDCIMETPDGALQSVKVPSSDDAPVRGLRMLLGLGRSGAEPQPAPIPACELRMGTTVATNALLERRGARTVLLITRGFADLPAIGTQARPDLFALSIVKPALLHERALEVDVRALPDGSTLDRRTLDEPAASALVDELARLRADGVESVAVAVLFGNRAPALERALGELAQRAGFEHVSLAHELAPEPGFLARVETALVDAYLTPVLRRYLATLAEQLPNVDLQVMQSSGALVPPERFRGPNALLSGPAGGAIALERLTAAHGLTATLGLDMGGTSTDVSRCAPRVEREHELTIDGLTLRAETVAIHTVAAGGGSLCRFDGHALRVGPSSAGARPGPVAYGSPEAREPTVTDANLVLGRAVTDRFPLPLNVERARHAFAALAREAGLESAEAAAAGCVEIADHHMAEAVRRVSVGKGHDPRAHALVVFGGAGGQHACSLARRLRIARVLCPPHAGLLSARGIGLADLAWHGGADLAAAPLGAAALQTARELGDALAAQGRAALENVHGTVLNQVLTTELQLELRHARTETRLTLPFDGSPESLRVAFDEAHERAFGHRRPAHPVECVAIRVNVRSAGAALAAVTHAAPQAPPAPRRRARVFAQGAFHDAPLFDRQSLAVGVRVRGPALVIDEASTVVVDPGFELEVLSDGTLELSALEAEPSAVSTAAHANVDPVLLEVLEHAYMSVAEQMGQALRRTALSTNIRERLDFSCAVFDADGLLVANAPHIPVHLGAMGESVRAVLAKHGADVADGDAFVTNDPAAGGSHLPDVTLVQPVFVDGARHFFVASRGHHADIGGRTPGSMPADSRTLADEGVVLRCLRVQRAGVFDERALLDALAAGPFPARAPHDNVADLRAQLAAGALGRELLRELCGRFGTQTVVAYLAHARAHAAARVRALLSRLPAGTFRFADSLDDGTTICVRLVVSDGALLVDFEGTSAEVEGNRNAPRSVTRSALLYVLRCLVGESIPLNDGCLEPVELRIAARSVLSPGPERAVAAGNVETSMRVVDVLLGAFGAAAASQGTMNNLALGDATFGYYETIGGGAGATAEAAGASGVHTHMTNTRITDAELLEERFPLRLLTFALRHGSGGAGAHSGGDGLIRELELLRPLTVSLLTERRRTQPFGLAGGGSGAAGLASLDGRPLDGNTVFSAPAGARLRLETPGGGGFGPASA